MTGCSEAADRDRGEQAELALKVFELSQALVEKWLAADPPAKRQLLDILFLNLRLEGTSLCYDMKKPFDVLAKGLITSQTRSDWTPVELFLACVLDLAVDSRARPA